MIAKPKAGPVRAAVYTRVSTADQAEGEFSSLDHQYESALAFITNHGDKRWTAIETRYADSGYSGANTERPALVRLLQDVADDKVDAIVVYRLDRITRSIYDFAKIINHLNKFNCSFISISEQFDTSNPQGKLHLNMMLSFSEFERELISARTKDKMIAARKRGRWSGGPPPLGYDLATEAGKLVVNMSEAERTRVIYELYLELGSLTETLREMSKRNWKTKSWTTRRGVFRRGKPFQKPSLRRLLTNPVFIGKISYGDQLFDGEHSAIVDHDLWERVQRQLKANGSNGGSGARNKHGALLRGILRCTPCNAAMTHTFTRKGNRAYRYYTCVRAQKHGWATCPTKSIPAEEIERCIVERIRAIGSDLQLVRKTVMAAHRILSEQVAQTQADIKVSDREHKRLGQERQALLETLSQGGNVAARAAERLDQVAEEIVATETRLATLRRELVDLQEQKIDEVDLAAAVGHFDPIWDVLLPRERARIVRLLIHQVDFNGETGTLGITFHPTGIKTLLAETECDEEETE